MVFRFHSPSEADISLYEKCFQNDEFCTSLYGHNNVNLKRFVSVEKGVLKYVTEKLDIETGYEPIGFAHFYPAKNGSLTYVGGITPELFNVGIGVRANIAMLTFVFQCEPKCEILAGVFKYNTRSLKMLIASGFKHMCSNEKRYILSLKKEDFENDFVNRIMSDIEYVII